MHRPILTPHMTEPAGDAVRQRQAQTVAGMAHFAGTGPEGAACMGCEHWVKGGRLKRKAGTLANRQCKQFTHLNGGVAGPGVPPITLACRHFVEAGNRPRYYVEPRRSSRWA